MPQALELANTFIDQNEFPADISPLTTIYQASTPVPINKQLTEEDLQHLANIDLNRTITPPPFPGVHSNLGSEGEGSPDRDALYHSSPPETPSGDLQKVPTMQDDDHDMDDGIADGDNTSDANHKAAHAKTPPKSPKTTPAARRTSHWVQGSILLPIVS